MLTARIDSLLKDYETETLLRARAEAEYQQAVRRRSAKIISGIAVGAVLLSAFFLLSSVATLPEVTVTVVSWKRPAVVPKIYLLSVKN